ncbi:hypothetical protein VT50_0228770 [Streptomyces antioxidans]|uniref:Uncharacterized protein n=1 Tax=Streptomyces antioxidans TaxID=1507734 RepID=A0A1V4CYK5_9ACTN|nr:hypothetical protein VT50_0228770 [Streptomyces antioxidans]
MTLQPQITIRCREMPPLVIAKLQRVALDCADVVELSRFYRSLLADVVNPSDPRWSLGEAGPHGTPTPRTPSGSIAAHEQAFEYSHVHW